MVQMVRNEALTAAVRTALLAWPLSRRDLASRAGVPNATLVKIAGGKLGASGEVAERLLAALEAWSDEQRSATKAMEEASGPLRRALRRAKGRSE